MSGLTVVVDVEILGGVVATSKEDDDLGLVVLERIMLAALRSAGAGPKAATERPGKAAGAAARAKANAEIFILVSDLNVIFFQFLEIMR
jgi:hypothetical protein